MDWIEQEHVAVHSIATNLHQSRAGAESGGEGGDKNGVEVLQSIHYSVSEYPPR